MAKGGARPGAGRKAGGKNKSTLEKEKVAKALAKNGQTPVEYMLELMHDKDKPEPIRLDAAKSAAPYVHPRLSSVEVKQDITVNDLTEKELDAEISRLATEAGALSSIAGKEQTH